MEKNKIMVAILFGIVLVFVAVSISLVFLKINEEDKEIENNPNSQEEQAVALDINSEIVSNLMNYVNISSDSFVVKNKITVNNLSVAEQYEMAFKEMDKEGITLGCDLTTMNEINQTSSSNIEDCFAFEYMIPEANLESAMKKVFGENVTFHKPTTELEFNFSTKWKYKDLLLQKGLVTFQENKFESVVDSHIYYDVEDRVFIGKYETEGGGIADKGIYSKVESASKKEKTITITEKVIFVDLYPITPSVVGYAETKEYIIYSDYNHTKQIGTISVADYETMLSNHDNAFDKLIDTYKEKAMTIIYTFEENKDGSYHFISSEIKN